jgi:mannosyltransferase
MTVGLHDEATSVGSGADGRLRPPTHARSAWVVGVVGTLLMLVAVDGASFWTDEAATISASTRPLPELFRMAQNLDAVHATYYALMHGWTAVFGTSELAMRAPSAVAVGAGAAGTYLLGHRLGGTRLAAWAAAVFLLLPRVTWMGAEARPFAFVTATAVWATVLLLACVARGRTRWWLGYAVLVTLGVLFNLYFVLVVAAHGVSVLLARPGRQTVVRWFAAAAVGGATTVPVVLEALGQSGQIGANRLGLADLARNVVVNQWFLGETPTIFSRSALVTATPVSSLPWRPAAVLLALVAAAVVARAVVLVVRRGRPWPPVAHHLAVWVAPWVVVPTAVLGLYALVSSTYSARYAAFSAPAVALAIAAALLAIRPVPWRVATAAVLVLCAAPVVVSQRTEHAKSGADWREAASAVDERCHDGDGVYFTPRAAPSDQTVRLTTRGIAVAYPEGFDDLVDVTLQSPPVRTDDLVGESLRLQDAGDRVSSLDRLCVVRRHDYPEAARAADDAFLGDAGLEVVDTWVGPLDEVVVLERS